MYSWGRREKEEGGQEKRANEVKEKQCWRGMEKQGYRSKRNSINEEMRKEWKTNKGA